MIAVKWDVFGHGADKHVSVVVALKERKHGPGGLGERGIPAANVMHTHSLRSTRSTILRR